MKTEKKPHGHVLLAPCLLCVLACALFIAKAPAQAVSAQTVSAQTVSAQTVSAQGNAGGIVSTGRFAFTEDGEGGTETLCFDAADLTVLHAELEALRSEIQTY